jgi:hypothetical protein
MKKNFFRVIYTAAGLLTILALPSCDTEALTDLNKNPNAIEYVIPEYSFTAAVLNSTPGQSFRPLGQGLQYFSSYKEVPAVGDKFYTFAGTVGSLGVYTGEWNRLKQLTEQIPGPENVNKRAAAEILRILAVHAQTDAIGDMPYTEAMKGLDNLKPKYDTQKSIYWYSRSLFQRRRGEMEEIWLYPDGTSGPPPFGSRAGDGKNLGRESCRRRYDDRFRGYRLYQICERNGTNESKGKHHDQR